MLKLFISFICILLVSCSDEPKRAEYDPDRMERYIKYNNGKFEAAWMDYSSSKALGFFTPDACIYPKNQQGICDTAGIKKFRLQQHQRGIRKQELLSLDFEKVNDVVKETGRYNLRDSNNALVESGTYAITWKQHRGYWKYHELRWN